MQHVLPSEVHLATSGDKKKNRKNIQQEVTLSGMLFHGWSSLISGVREVLSSFPAIWASAGAFLVFIHAGFAIDCPTAGHLVWSAGHMKADLTNQSVWWRLHKIAVISTCRLSSWSHLSQLETTCIVVIYVVTQLYEDVNKCKVAAAIPSSLVTANNTLILIMQS